jgi:hypothetical protein
MSPQLELLALVAAAVMALLGVPLVLIGTLVRRRIKRFNSRAVTVVGNVVDNEEHYSTSGGFNRRIYFPVVEFAPQVGGTARAKGLGQRDPVPLGTPVQLLYDPSQPEDVSFTGPKGQAGVASMLSVIGWILLLLAVGAGVAPFVLR